MTETLNINVLVAAKEEYTKQLVYILSPEIYKVILNVYNDSQQLKKKRSISLKNFQLCLKKIPFWNTIIIEKNTEDIKSKTPYLLDLITAIFVSHVKILACVKLKQDSKSIQVKVPNLDNFLHKIIITNAEKIYYNPDIILKKKEIVVSLISDTIEETIRNQIPIDKILTEYLAGVFENDNQNTEETKQNKENNNTDETDETDEEYEEIDEKENYEDDDELESDEDIEEDLEDADTDINKNIVPSRPLPPHQLNNESNGNNGNNGEKYEIAEPEESHLASENNKIPTKEINKVLFGDSKDKKYSNESEDELDELDEYTDSSTDEEN
jgi:hypothetical protein